MRTILSNPGLTELTNFFEGDLSFSDIRHILEDENMGDDIKSLLITRVREVTFHEVHSLILSYTEGSGAYYLLDVIKKIQSLSYHEIEDILRNSDINYSVKLYLISKIDRVQIGEIESFVNDDTLSLQVRRKLAERIIYDFNIQKYLAESGYDGGKISRAVEVNKWQSQLIVGDILLPKSMREVPEERTLNFYYREGQGAFLPHFEIFVRLLQDFIHGGNSEVWNNFRILHRWSGYDKEIGGIQTSSSAGINFRSESSIYADTIHLTHGTPEKIPGTHAIVGKSLYRDSHKLTGIYYSKGQYTRIPLLYTRGNSKEGLGFPLNQNMSDMCSTLLESIQNAERRILDNIHGET